MTVQPAQVQGGLGPVVEAIESLPPDELAAALPELGQQAGSPRHMVLAGLLAAARSLDWAPLDERGAFDLLPATARHVECWIDRLPARLRARAGLLWIQAVSHRIHAAGENAPFVLPEIAPDPERMRETTITYAEVEADLERGAVTRALHGWPCCRSRVHWSKLSETIVRLTLAESSTFGARAATASNIRRVLEILGREHKHPVITALFRALALAPRGANPSADLEIALAGIESPDRADITPPADVDALESMSARLGCAADLCVAAADEMRRGAAPRSVALCLSLNSARAALLAGFADPARARTLSDALVVVAGYRDLDGLESDAVRPRLVAAAAHALAARIQRDRENAGAGAATGGDAAADHDAVGTINGAADLNALRAALAARDARAASAAGFAIGQDARKAAEAIALLDTTLLETLSFEDLSPLRLHIAACDEFRRTRGRPAAMFLALSAGRVAAI